MSWAGEHLDARASGLRGVTLVRARVRACVRARGRSGLGTRSGFGTNRQHVCWVDCLIRDTSVY